MLVGSKSWLKDGKVKEDIQIVEQMIDQQDDGGDGDEEEEERELEGELEK